MNKRPAGKQQHLRPAAILDLTSKEVYLIGDDGDDDDGDDDNNEDEDDDGEKV